VPGSTIPPSFWSSLLTLYWRMAAWAIPFDKKQLKTLFRLITSCRSPFRVEIVRVVPYESEYWYVHLSFCWSIELANLFDQARIVPLIVLIRIELRHPSFRCTSLPTKSGTSSLPSPISSLFSFRSEVLSKNQREETWIIVEVKTRRWEERQVGASVVVGQEKRNAKKDWGEVKRRKRRWDRFSFSKPPSLPVKRNFRRRSSETSEKWVTSCALDRREGHRSVSPLDTSEIPRCLLLPVWVSFPPLRPFVLFPAPPSSLTHNFNMPPANESSKTLFPAPPSSLTHNFNMPPANESSKTTKIEKCTYLLCFDLSLSSSAESCH